jgi:hypothetical protein
MNLQTLPKIDLHLHLDGGGAGGKDRETEHFLGTRAQLWF